MQNQIEHPKDLSLQVPIWLENALKLTETHNIKEISRELKALTTIQKTPSFQLAFVGESRRGKSTLINQLLKRPLLPTRTIATTTTFTSLVANAETAEHMEMSFSDGCVERRPLVEASWHNLVAHNKKNQTHRVLQRVRLLFNHLWLQQLDAEVVDTPGLDDSKSPQALFAPEALGHCDAAVLVVSAMLPFSLTEAAFLERQLLGQHIPHVTVVVSKLDMIPEDQRAEQFKIIQDRVAQVAPLIPVLPAYPPDANTSETDVFEALRCHIEMLTNKADRHAWRSQQEAATIADSLGRLIQITQATIASLQISEVEREEARLQVRSEARDAELKWERIALEFGQRCFKVDSQLRQNLCAHQKSLLAKTSSELIQAPEPILWWQRNFPFFLRQEFLGIEQKVELYLAEAFSNDVKWLQEEVTCAFNIQLNTRTIIAMNSISIVQESQKVISDNVRWKRLLINAGAAAAAIAGIFLLTSNPQSIPIAQSLDIFRFGGSVGQGVSNLAEPLLSLEVEQQQQQIYQEAQRSIERCIDEYSLRMSERLHEFYQQKSHAIQKERISLQTARKTAIETNGSVADENVLQQLISEASSLQHTILVALENK
jgi:GTPase Era involved in 16S rRNA processing